MPVLDANVFLRFLTNDNADHSPRAAIFFRQLERGARSAFLPEGVLSEIVYTFGSKNLYNASREKIREEIGSLIRLPAIEMAYKNTYIEALDLFVTYPRLSYLDALCIAHAKRLGDATVISFDRGYRNIEGVTREEP